MDVSGIVPRNRPYMYHRVALEPFHTLAKKVNMCESRLSIGCYTFEDMTTKVSIDVVFLERILSEQLQCLHPLMVYIIRVDEKSWREGV